MWRQLAKKILCAASVGMVCGVFSRDLLAHSPSEKPTGKAPFFIDASGGIHGDVQEGTVSFPQIPDWLKNLKKSLKTVASPPPSLHTPGAQDPQIHYMDSSMGVVILSFIGDGDRDLQGRGHNMAKALMALFLCAQPTFGCVRQAPLPPGVNAPTHSLSSPNSVEFIQFNAQRQNQEANAPHSLEALFRGLAQTQDPSQWKAILQSYVGSIEAVLYGQMEISTLERYLNLKSIAVVNGDTNSAGPGRPLLILGQTLLTDAQVQMQQKGYDINQILNENTQGTPGSYVYFVVYDLKGPTAGVPRLMSENFLSQFAINGKLIGAITVSPLAVPRVPTSPQPDVPTSSQPPAPATPGFGETAPTTSQGIGLAFVHGQNGQSPYLMTANSGPLGPIPQDSVVVYKLPGTDVLEVTHIITPEKWQSREFISGGWVNRNDLTCYWGNVCMTEKPTNVYAAPSASPGQPVSQIPGARVAVRIGNHSGAGGTPWVQVVNVAVGIDALPPETYVALGSTSAGQNSRPQEQALPHAPQAATRPPPPAGTSLNAIPFPKIDKKWRPEWNGMVAKSILKIKDLDPDGVNRLLTNIPPDLNALYPGGLSKQPPEVIIGVWTGVFGEIIRKESGFNTKTSYMESWGVASQGLFQLSYGDEAGYPGCEIDASKGNIEDPAVQFQCAALIMNRQLANKKSLFTNEHFYWSVLTNYKDAIRDEVGQHIKEIRQLKEAKATQKATPPQAVPFPPPPSQQPFLEQNPYGRGGFTPGQGGVPPPPSQGPF